MSLPKYFTLQVVSETGEVQTEEKMVLGEGDKLILQYDEVFMTTTKIVTLYDNVRRFLTHDEAKVLMIPQSVKIHIIHPDTEEEDE